MHCSEWRFRAQFPKLTVSLAEQVTMDNGLVLSKVETRLPQSKLDALVFISVEVGAILQLYTRTWF